MQTDIKRVLAYSTVSQLGYMFMACGVGAFKAGIFHLMTHAFFKALLFLGGGLRDSRASEASRTCARWADLQEIHSLTFGVMFIATLAISGIPGFAGFFSKDEILWQAYSSSHGHWALWLIGLIDGADDKLLYVPADFHDVLRRVPRSDQRCARRFGARWACGDDHGHHGEPHESPWIMLAPLVLLAVLSVVGGWIGVPKALGGSNHFHHFLSPVLPVVSGESSHATVAKESSTTAETSSSAAEPREEAESLADIRRERLLTGDSTLAAFVGLFLAPVRQAPRIARMDRGFSAGGLYTTVLNKYYVDEIYGAAIIRADHRLLAHGALEGHRYRDH